MADLHGKAAIVTGASRGIGAAAAKALAEAGVAVVLAARTADEIEANAEAIREAGGKARAVTCDVASYEDLDATVKTCVADFGRLDFLINNAGVIEPIARLADSDPAEWDRVVDINLKGVYHGLRAAIPAMLESGGGVVVNISSGAATGALEGWSHYCSTKAAVLSLTRCAHKEYADRGVRVVGLSPGTVATDMQVQIRASGINPISQLDPSVHIPADWVGQAVAWLCSADASAFGGDDVALRDEALRRRIGLID